MEVTAGSIDHIRTLYHWDQQEDHRERFTCRPVPALLNLDVLVQSTSQRLNRRALRIFILWDKARAAPLGRVNLRL